jgi:hypothetical protein
MPSAKSPRRSALPPSHPRSDDEAAFLAPFDPVRTLNEYGYLLERLGDILAVWEKGPWPARIIVRYSTMPKKKLVKQIKGLEEFVCIDLLKDPATGSPRQRIDLPDCVVCEWSGWSLGAKLAKALEIPADYEVWTSLSETMLEIPADEVLTPLTETQFICLLDMMRASVDSDKVDLSGVKCWSHELAHYWNRAGEHAVRLAVQLRRGRTELLDVDGCHLFAIRVLWEEVAEVADRFRLFDERSPRWVSHPNPDYPLSHVEPRLETVDSSHVANLRKSLWKFAGGFCLIRDVMTGEFAEPRTMAAGESDSPFLVTNFLTADLPHPVQIAFELHKKSWPPGCTYRQEQRENNERTGVFRAVCSTCGHQFETDLVDLTNLHAVYRPCSANAATAATKRTGKPVARTDHVTLYSEKERPVLDGVEMPPLTRAQHKVLLAIIGAMPDGLTKDDLDNRDITGVDAGRSALMTLRRKTPDWKKAIIFPGDDGKKRYRIL